jgi:hypothetical protein
MFRDGVSEGQFAIMLDQGPSPICLFATTRANEIGTEVNAIRVACQSIQADYKPKITYMIVGKVC